MKDTTKSVPDIVWYGRLVVWVGAAILLVQAVLGRGSSLMSELAVMSIAGGFAAFLGGLSIGLPETVAEFSPTVEAPNPAIGVADTPETRPQGGDDEMAMVHPYRLGSATVGQPNCPRCRELLNIDQMVVDCPVCEAAHHIECWIDADSGCSVGVCAGHGRLVPGSTGTG